MQNKELNGWHPNILCITDFTIKLQVGYHNRNHHKYPEKQPEICHNTLVLRQLFQVIKLSVVIKEAWGKCVE